MMRKIFEAPAMSIYKFKTENVVTTSGAEPQTGEAKAKKALSEKGLSVEANNVLSFNFD